MCDFMFICLFVCSNRCPIRKFVVHLSVDHSQNLQTQQQHSVHSRKSYCVNAYQFDIKLIFCSTHYAQCYLYTWCGHDLARIRAITLHMILAENVNICISFVNGRALISSACCRCVFVSCCFSLFCHLVSIIIITKIMSFKLNGGVIINLYICHMTHYYHYFSCFVCINYIILLNSIEMYRFNYISSLHAPLLLFVLIYNTPTTIIIFIIILITIHLSNLNRHLLVFVRLF